MIGTTVADVMIGGLARLGAPHGFRRAGARPRLPLGEAAQRQRWPVITVQSVTAACVMAAVTADLTGAPGAVLLESMTEFSDVAHGLRHAFRDRSPVIVITPTPSGPDAPGGVASATGDVASSFVKASIEATAASASHWIAHAGHLALEPPRGPVHLALAGPIARAPAVPLATSRPAGTSPAPTACALDEAARWLGGASRPVIVAGIDARSEETATWLRAFAEALPAPVVTTPKAKGVLPDPHPLSLGVLGGSVATDSVLARADLIVAIGLDPIELAASGHPSAPMLHLSPSPWASASAALPPFTTVADVEASPRVTPVAEVHGVVGLILEELAPRLRDRARADWDVAELDQLRRALRRGATVSATGLTAERVMEILREATLPGTMAAVEPGTLARAALARWDAVGPGEFLVANGGLESGFALPAALAAKLARPDRPVVCLTDRAGLMTAGIELPTAVQLGLDVLIVVVDDDVQASVAVARDSGMPVLEADAEVGLLAVTARALASAGPRFVAATIGR